MKTFLMSTAAALLVAGSAYSADVLVLIDTDNDGRVSVEEYNAASSGWADYRDPMWTLWDEDEDGMLSADEWNRGIWTHYDADADGSLNPDELKAWDEDQLRYDSTRSGREISPPG